MTSVTGAFFGAAPGCWPQRAPLGALAPSMEILVAARVLQGVAGGGILAAGLGSIGRAFPSGTARTHATAVWGASVGAGVTVGPLAGAGLATAVGWRTGFWLEAAAAAAVMTAAATLSESRTTARVRLDLAGISTLGAAMTFLTAALVETRHGWSATTTLVLFAAATLMLGAFAAVELRSRRPMLDPHLLGQPRFLASISGALFTGLGRRRVDELRAGGDAAVPAHQRDRQRGGAGHMVSHQHGRGARRGLTAHPATTRRRGCSSAWPWRPSVSSRSPVLAAGTSWTRLVPGLFVTGLGTGVVNAALGRIAVESVPPGRAGMGSGANNTARYLGGAAGAALIVSIASAGGAHRLIDGWNIAALVSAGLSAVGVAIVASCRTWRRHSAPSTGHGSRGKEHLPAVPTPWTPPSPAQVLDRPDSGCRAPGNRPPPLTHPEDRMTSQLNYLIVQQRHIEFAYRAEQARLADQARAARSAFSPRRLCPPPPRDPLAAGTPPSRSCREHNRRVAARRPEMRHMTTGSRARVFSAARPKS